MILFILGRKIGIDVQILSQWQWLSLRCWKKSIREIRISFYLYYICIYTYNMDVRLLRKREKFYKFVRQSLTCLSSVIAQGKWRLWWRNKHQLKCINFHNFPLHSILTMKVQTVSIYRIFCRNSHLGINDLQKSLFHFH